MELIHGGDLTGYRERYGLEPLDFSANVSPLGLPEGVRRAVTEALDAAWAYPDPLCRRLCHAIGEAEHLPGRWVLCGNGAADLIFRLVLAVKPQLGLIPTPTFAEYEQALSAFGCDIRHHVLCEKDDFAITQRLLEDITPEVDMLFLCQPNNPTGQICPRELLLKILEQCRVCNTLLVLDECFVSFLDDPQQHTLKDMLKQYPNLIILKAFTKLYAMAGLRLGYCLCANRSLLDSMQCCGQPWSVSSLAQSAGIAALQETEYVKRVRSLVQEQRPRLIAGLSALGCRCTGSRANFIFFYCAFSELENAVNQKGIMIRSCANYTGLGKGWYRIAVRTQEENDRLLTVFKEVLS